MTLSGRIYDLDPALYYGSSALAQSRLKAMRHVNRGTVTYVPANLKYELDNPRKETAALTRGRVFHQLQFTPEDKQWWAVKPEGMKFSTTEGSKWRAQQLEAGRTIIEHKDFQQVSGMCQAVWDHDDTRAILEDSKFEVSLFATATKLGDLSCVVNGEKLALRSRLDAERQRVAVIEDFKSCQDASEEAFKWAIWEYGYHIQGYFYSTLYEYLTGTKVEAFRITAIESKPPHNLKVYELSERMLEAGAKELHAMLALYLECKRSGVWPGLPPGVKTIELPEFVYKGLEAA